MQVNGKQNAQANSHHNFSRDVSLRSPAITGAPLLIFPLLLMHYYAPVALWSYIYPWTMYIATAVFSLGIPGPCKLLLGVLLWLHGMRAILWIWLGIMPPLALFAGMYMLPGIPPSYGTPPWSPVGGIIGGVAAVLIGMAAVYNVHEPSSDCDHSGVVDQSDALCEIRREVIFLDIQSDGEVFWERIALLVFFALMMVSLLDHFHGNHSNLRTFPLFSTPF